MLQACILTLALTAALAASIDPGIAKGTLTVNQESIELKHAYAFRHDNGEGLLDGPELRILICDRPISDYALAGYDGPMRLQQMVRAGNLRGILLRLDARKTDNSFNGTLYYPPVNPQATLLFFSVSGGDALRNLKIANNRVVGEASYELSSERPGSELPSFKFSAAFSAPLFHDEPITAKLSAPAAAKSGPAECLLAFERAVRLGNFELARGLATEEKWNQLESHRAQVGEEMFRNTIKQMIPPTAQRARQIKQVFVRTSRAVIVLNDGTGTTVISVVNKGGKWKVD